METRFKKKAKIFDIGVAAVAVILSVGMMLYGVFFYGLKETWPELVLNLFYIACLVMMGLYFFNRLDTQPCTSSIGSIRSGSTTGHRCAWV